MGAGAKVWFAVKAASLVASVAYSANQSSKARKAMRNSGLDQGRTIMVRDPLAPRRLIYGQALVSGTVVFMHTTGTKNEYLHFVVMLAGHEVDEIGDIYFNDELVPLASNAATGKYAGYARVNKKRGVPGDVADADLVAEMPAFWTANHKLSGCAYLTVSLTWSPDLFPNGLPTVKALVKGKKVYDPRTGLTVWTANAALCAADFLQDTTFCEFYVALARIRSADLIEAANTCDESIILADASTEARYTVDGTISADQDPSDILRDLAGAMAGSIIDTGGTWTIRAGAYRTPTVTLTDDDLVSGFSMQPRQSRSDTFNRVRGVYISPDMQWAPADFPAVSNSTYKTADGGIWLDKDIQLNFTTSPARAQRLAKIELERGRQQITCQASYNLKALQLMPGDVVNVTRSRFGWAAKPFEVVECGLSISGDQDNPTLNIPLILRETAAGVWDWANGEETTVDLAPNTTLPNPFSVPTPSTPTLTSVSQMQADGTVEPRFTVAWTTPNNIHVEQGGAVAIEYKAQADSVWLEWAQLRGDMLSELIGGVVVGEIYDVRIRFINNAGVRGAYSATASVTVLGDVTAPATPTGLVAIAGTGKVVSLDWNDNTEPDLGEYGIYRHTADVVGSAVLIAEVAASRFVDVDVTPGTTYYYWITAIDRSDNESAKTASVNATPSAAGAGVDTTPPSNPSVPTLVGSLSYQTMDGTTRASATIAVPAMPVGGVILNVLYRLNGSTAGWTIADQLSAGSVSAQVDDLLPNTSYQYAVQAFSSYGYASSIVTGASAFLTNYDASAPAAPAGLAAVTGTGKSVSLDWADNTEADFSEYAVYRHTSNSSGSATKLAETRASRFVDVDVTFGQAYYYWIKAIDRSENTSAFSSGVGPVTPGKVAATEADATAPGTPSASSKTAEGTYTAGDGTVYAYLDISVPALPTLGKYQNLLYKKASGGGDWLVAAQLTNTGAQTVRIDDLSPGTIYDVAVQAFTAFAIASAITVATASPFTAPNLTTAPSVTGVAYIAGNSSSFLRPPSMIGTLRAAAVRVNWTRPSEKDLVGYEVAVTSTDTDAAADAASKTIVVSEEFIALNSIPVSAYVRVRAFNSSAVRGAWGGGGTNLNTSSLWGYPGGNMMSQDSSGVSVTGGSATGMSNLTSTNLTGTDTIVNGIRTGGSGARKIVAEYAETVVPTLAGGAASESAAVSISGRGFAAKPDTGYIEVCSDLGIGCHYYFDHVSNSSSTAYIRFFRWDGANLSAGSVRCSVCLVEYD